MGMLSAAVFQGAGAGLNSLGGAMMKGAEKEQDEALYQKRAQMLADLQLQYKGKEAAQALEFEGADSTLEARGKIAKSTAVNAAGAKAAGDKALWGDTEYQAAKRAQDDSEAKDAAARAREVSKDAAGDKAYVKSIETLKLADPTVRANVAQSLAAAGASAAQAKLAAEQLKNVADVNAMAAQVRGLQSKLAAAKTDEEKAALQDQITALGFTGKDTKGFLSIAEKAIDNGNAALKVLSSADATPEAREAATLQLQRANEFATKASQLAGVKVSSATEAPYKDGTELRGKDGQVYVVQNGQPVLKSAIKPAAANKGAAAPAGPGLLSSLGDLMGAGAAEGQRQEAVRAKVNAGKPLNAEETKLARLMGLGV